MGLRMRVHDKEPISKAMIRFKKLIERSGMKKELRAHAYYEKPVEQRRRAVLRNAKLKQKVKVLCLTAELVEVDDSQATGGEEQPVTKTRSGKSAKSNNIDVADLRGRLGLSQLDFARITGYSPRSIAGWEGGQRLGGPARQKLRETRRLFDALAELMRPDDLKEWMRVPNPSFEGRTPLQVIERGESDRLWRMIAQIDGAVAN